MALITIIVGSVEDRPILQPQEFGPPALTAATEDTPTLQGEGHSTKTTPNCEEIVVDGIETAPVCRKSVQAMPTLNVGVEDTICNAIAGDEVGVAGDSRSGDGKVVVDEGSVGEGEFPFVPSTPVSSSLPRVCLHWLPSCPLMVFLSSSFASSPLSRSILT